MSNQPRIMTTVLQELYDTFCRKKKPSAGRHWHSFLCFSWPVDWGADWSEGSGVISEAGISIIRTNIRDRWDTVIHYLDNDKYQIQTLTITKWWIMTLHNQCFLRTCCSTIYNFAVNDLVFFQPKPRDLPVVTTLNSGEILSVCLMNLFVVASF